MPSVELLKLAHFEVKNIILRVKAPHIPTLTRQVQLNKIGILFLRGILELLPPKELNNAQIMMNDEQKTTPLG